MKMYRDEERTYTENTMLNEAAGRLAGETAEKGTGSGAPLEDTRDTIHTDTVRLRREMEKRALRGDAPDRRTAQFILDVSNLELAKAEARWEEAAWKTGSDGSRSEAECEKRLKEVSDARKLVCAARAMMTTAV